MVKSPPPLALPGCGVAREPADEDELAAACDMLEDVVTLNKDYTAPFETRDMRMIFVSGTRDEVGAFAEDVLSLCPKSWPCALWMCDRVGRTCGLPFTQYSARRLLSAAVFLLLSTEDDAVVKLAKKARRSLQKLEYLGWGLLQLLREQPHLDNTDAGRMVGPDPRAWEEIVGMDRLGMVRGCLPMVAKSVRGGGERAAAGFVHVLSGMGRSESSTTFGSSLLLTSPYERAPRGAHVLSGTGLVSGYFPAASATTVDEVMPSRRPVMASVSQKQFENCEHRTLSQLAELKSALQFRVNRTRTDISGGMPSLGSTTTTATDPLGSSVGDVEWTMILDDDVSLSRTCMLPRTVPLYDAETGLSQTMTSLSRTLGDLSRASRHKPRRAAADSDFPVSRTFFGCPDEETALNQTVRPL